MSNIAQRNSVDEDALALHAAGNPGKYEIRPTKPLSTPHDLSLAYTPGVAAPCREIHKVPSLAYKYTNKGNLVAVVSNGTAVLGLGNLGALASKPVMEGKAVLFKKFADVDSVDLCVDTPNVEEFINSIRFLSPSFGGINLEDIRGPDCFAIENRLRELMDIPVFHDDQHGTAIVVGAAVLNGLKIVGKSLGTVKVVSTGGGAAGIACLNFLVSLGVKRENIWLADIAGVVYSGRTEEMNPYKAVYAQPTDARTLSDIIDGADIFLGLSGPGVLTPEMVGRMGKQPIILALANPTPEITPEEVRKVRDDAIMATGRSDYPNQVNNVLGFPYIFRGALDVRAKTINQEMKIAAARALASLARESVPDDIRAIYGTGTLDFGPEYIIPVPFDHRLLEVVAPAVAQAAMDSGIAAEPIADMVAYRKSLRARIQAG